MFRLIAQDAYDIPLYNNVLCIIKQRVQVWFCPRDNNNNNNIVHKLSQELSRGEILDAKSSSFWQSRNATLFLIRQ